MSLGPVWGDAILIALILAFWRGRSQPARSFCAPVAAGGASVRDVERSKGAVPILLAAFALLAGVGGADRIYGIVFVVVAFSVIVQGATIPFVARRFGVPMRTVYRDDGDRRAPGPGRVLRRR